MRHILLGLAAILMSSAAGFAAEGKGIRFWNLTSSTIVNFQLSPAGQNSWGKNQCENDRDGSVDHDERLKISGIQPGRYDARLKDKDGRICVVRDIAIEAGAVFSIEEKQLTGCTK
jgi:hypothetical protein